MRGVTDMAQQKSRWATKGALAMAATALAVTGCAAGPLGRLGGAAPAAAGAAPAATAGRHEHRDHQRGVAAAYTAPTRNLAQGMSGADVKSLQQRLAALKYYPGAIDGKFGSDTLAALWAFQEINGVHVSGVVDASTKRALVNPKTYKSPSYAGKRATRSRSARRSRSWCCSRTTRSC